MTTLAKDGWTLSPSRLSSAALDYLRVSAFAETRPGQRCLLGNDAVRQVAIELKNQLIESGVLPTGSVAIQAIAFDKNPAANWKVTWHQDLMFPIAGPATAPDYELPSIKDEVHYARPPRHVLEELLAVRLHLDDCDQTNGPLRVAPGSHAHAVAESFGALGSIQPTHRATCRHPQP
jgi:ectoine hydroxylase-related dioxygenase (phytanoyl-CoA dioxygenase family)